MNVTAAHDDTLARKLERDIGRIATRVARNASVRADLRQEMRCYLLTLPPRKSRSFYLRALGIHAFNYWGRVIIDAPLDPTGRPILERQTIAIGGLAELERIHQRQRAA